MVTEERRLSLDVLLVQGKHDVPVAVDPLADLTPELASNQCRGTIPEVTEEMLPPGSPRLGDIPESLRNQQADRRGAMLDQRVGGDGRAVGDGLDVGKGGAPWASADGEDIHDALDDIAGRG